jgi:hypothetical protein
MEDLIWRPVSGYGRPRAECGRRAEGRELGEGTRTTRGVGPGPDSFVAGLSVGRGSAAFLTLDERNVAPCAWRAMAASFLAGPLAIALGGGQGARVDRVGRSLAAHVVVRVAAIHGGSD